MKREWVSWLMAGLVGFGIVAVGVQFVEVKRALAELEGRIAELEAGQAAAAVLRAEPEPGPAPAAPTDRGAVKEGAMGSWDGQVGHSLDDATCDDVGWWPTRDFVAFIPSSITESAWLRFRNVAVPQAAVITLAKLSFCAWEDFGEISGEVTLRGQDEDDASVVSSCAELAAESWTTASAQTQYDPWTKDEWYDSPEIKAVVQEIVDRPEWVEGNAMGFCGIISVGLERTFYAYDADPTKAAKLHIEWRPPISTEDTAVLADTVRLGLGPGPDPDPDDGGTTGLSDRVVLADTFRPGLRLSDTLVLVEGPTEDGPRIVRPCQGRAIPGQPCPKP